MRSTGRSARSRSRVGIGRARLVRSPLMEPQRTFPARVRKVGKSQRLAVSAWLARLDGRVGALIVVVASLGVYAFDAIAWPVRVGRNLGLYLLYYVDMWHSKPVLPELMLTIKPLPSLVFGVLLEYTGALGTSIALALMFAGAIVAYTMVADMLFGRWVAALAAILLLVYPPFASLFHQPSGDVLFAFAMAIWSVCLARTLRSPAPWKFAVQAVAIFCLAMTRSANEMLAIAALSPLLLVSLPWRRRLVYTSTFVAATVVGLLGVMAYDGLRYGDYTVSRTANANFPLFRVFAYDHLVSPKNGPASRQLAQAVAADLLTRQPYKAYGITVDQFFAASSTRYWSDLVPLYDRYWGWSGRYVKLRTVAVEAIRAHPATYAHDVERTVVDEFSLPTYTAVTMKAVPTAAHPAPPEITVKGRRLPQPSEGQPIPGSNLDWMYSTRDGSISKNWTAIGRPVLRFRDPAVGRRYARNAAREGALAGKLGRTNGSASFAHFLNRVEHLFPPLWLWLLVGAAGLTLRRPRNVVPILTLAAIGLTVALGSALGQPDTPSYRIPFDPIFILFGLAGLLAPRRGSG